MIGHVGAFSVGLVALAMYMIGHSWRTVMFGR
jgi:hypothetical protein